MIRTRLYFGYGWFNLSSYILIIEKMLIVYFLRSLIWTPGVAVLFSACTPHTINPDPQPLAQAPTSYSLKVADGNTFSGPWYETFGDPALTRLIDTALQNNFDVQQAVARLKQAGFLADAANATRLPSANLVADAARTRDDGDNETATAIGAALSWEIDAFNRLGAVATAREYEERVAAADIDTVRLSLAAEISEAWFNAVAQNVQLRLLRQQSGSDGKLLDLVQQRLDAGVGTNVEVLQQKSQLAENDSLIPPAEANLRVYENRLDVLSGQAPDTANRTSTDADFAKIGDVPALGVPSDLLLNRPDLRAFKNALIASDAEIGAAIADRLPRITLTGSHIYAGGSGGGAVATSVLAGLVQPLLDWGRRKAEVERNKALYEERLAAFSQAYLEAMEDVENALYLENRQREYISRLELRSDVLQKTLTAAESVYREGESGYLPVIEAVKDLRNVERDLVTQRLNLVLYRIQLYRALGGQTAS